jgi:hypothetical protein
MYSNGEEENLRRYLHVAAFLKHFSSGRRDKHRCVVHQPDVMQTLIEQSNRSQAGKWRRYVKGESVRPNCPSRPDAA